MKRWIVSKVYFWEEAPFFRLLLPLILAIVCYDQLLIPPMHNKQWLLLALSALALGVLIIPVANSFRLASVRAAGVHLSIFLIGWVLCSIYDVRNVTHWFGKNIANAEGHVVTVLEKPVERAKTWRVKVNVESAVKGNDVIETTGEAILYLYKGGQKTTISTGDKLLLPNRWNSITNPGNPHEFDYARFSGRNNIYYAQFLTAGEIEVLEKAVNGASPADKAHDWGMNTLEQYIQDSAALGLMQAMLLGDEVNFGDDLRKIYTDTGIVHIVAISGSHVAIFFLLATSLLFWINKKHEYIKYLVAIPLIWFYVVVAGMPTSAVRAGAMFTLVGLGFALGRNQNSLNTLFATAFIMLIANPMWLYAIGFQLSFIAVLSLILFYSPICKLIYFSNRFARKLWQVVAASIAAEILIAPVIIYYFHLLPASFLAANVLAYMFMGLVLVGGMLLILIGKLAILAKPVGLVLSYLVVKFNDIAQHLQDLNPPSLAHLQLSSLQLLLTYFIIAALAAFLMAKVRHGLIAGMSGCVLLIILLTADHVRALQQDKFIVYNINGSSYAELIRGNRFIPVITDSSLDAKRWEYATKEMHTASGAWRPGKNETREVIYHHGQSFLVLNEPLDGSYDQSPAFDYVILNYPLKTFKGRELLNTFNCKQLIIGSNQKRYIAAQWRDSCLKYNIPAHFTQFDGAFISQ